MRIYEAKVAYSLVSLGEEIALTNAELAVAYMKGAFDEYPVQESFWVILLDRKNHPLCRMMITLGTTTNSLVHPREVFRSAIRESACAVICVHNHPSGDPTPSSADNQVTRQLREAAKTVCIDLLDHVIIGTPEGDPNKIGYYSFRTAGLV